MKTPSFHGTSCILTLFIYIVQDSNIYKPTSLGAMKLSIIFGHVLFAATTLAAPRSKEDLSRRSTILPLHGILSVHGQSHPARIIDNSTAGPINPKIVTNTVYEDSTNWAGAVLYPPPTGQTFTSVQGEFTVPSPTVPSSSAPGWYYASIFVGIDGWNDDVVVQAGVFIETEYTSSGETASYYYAWYEWYPESQIEISNLPVSAGNVIYISLTASGTSEATLLLENLSEGVGVEGTISAPDSAADLLGQSVEWIVEDPSDGSSLFPFFDFGTVTFLNIAAGTSTGASLNLGYANTTLLDIVTVSGNTITGVESSETILSDTSVEISYV
jgi:hypothetical protein